MFRDFRATMAKSCLAQHSPRRPTFRTLSTTRNILFQSHFKTAIGEAEKVPELANPLPKLRPRKRAPLISDEMFRDFRVIVEKARPTHRNSGRPPIGDLNATDDIIFPESFPVRYRID